MIPEPPGIVSRPFARTLSIFRALLKLAPTGWAVLKNMLKSTAQLENTGRRGTRTNSKTPASVLTAGGSDALGAWRPSHLERPVVGPEYELASRLNTRATTSGPPTVLLPRSRSLVVIRSVSEGSARNDSAM